MAGIGKANVSPLGPGANPTVNHLRANAITLPITSPYIPPAGSISFADGSDQSIYFGNPTSAPFITKSGAYGCVETFANSSAVGGRVFRSYDASFAEVFAVICGGGNTGVVKTKPPASFAPALTLGAAWQNTNAYDVTLVISLAISVNTSLVVSLGVGPTNAPAQQTLISGTTVLGIVPITIKVPAGYYALLSSSGVGTDAIVGQIGYCG